jgi:hypothetical protein
MPKPRISIAKLKQLIQLESSKLSTREACRALNLSHGAVCKYRSVVREAGLRWEDVQGLDEAQLERRIWLVHPERAPRPAVLPDCASIHTELKRHRHVTL